jgi:hypothetical protein
MPVLRIGKSFLISVRFRPLGSEMPLERLVALITEGHIELNNSVNFPLYLFLETPAKTP